MVRSAANLCAVLLVVVSFNASLAQENDAAAPADPTGTWKWERTFNDNPAEFLLKLNWDGKELSGTYSAFGNTSQIEQTKLEKDGISFLAKREFNGNRFEVKFDGKVKSDELVGKVTVDFGDGPQDFDWQAKRAVESDDVLGTWNFRLETPNGVIEPRLTITEKDDELHGAYVSPFGERDAKIVRLDNNELSWEISGERDGAQFKIVYKGRPRGNKIEGSTEFDFGGNTGTMDFTGERTPPEEKKDESKATDDESATEAANTDAPLSAGEN